MQRPDLPHKKAVGYIGLVALILTFTWRHAPIPDWIAYIGFGLFAALLLYCLYWSLRQGCHAYSMMIVGIMLFCGATWYLVGSWTPDKAGSMFSSNGNPDIPIGILLVLSAILFISCIISIIFWIKYRKEPEKQARSRHYFRIIFLIFSLLLTCTALAMLYL